MFPDAITIDDALANAQRGIAVERPAIVRPFFDNASLSARHIQTMKGHVEQIRIGLENERRFALDCQAQMRSAFENNSVEPQHLMKLKNLTAFIEEQLRDTGQRLGKDLKVMKRQLKDFKRYLTPAHFNEYSVLIDEMEGMLLEEWDLRSDLAMFLRALYVEQSEDLSKAPKFDNPDDLEAYLLRAIG